MAEFSFSKTSDKLQAHWRSLLDIRDQMKALPTTRPLAERLTRLCSELDDITEELVAGDQTGNG